MPEAGRKGRVEGGSTRSVNGGRALTIAKTVVPTKRKVRGQSYLSCFSTTSWHVASEAVAMTPEEGERGIVALSEKLRANTEFSPHLQQPFEGGTIGRAAVA